MTATIYEGKSKVLSHDKDISSSSLFGDHKQKNLQIDNIKSLDIAEGLKNLLIIHGFTIELLLTISATELANALGIDEYVAKIICQSANRDSF